VTNDQIADAIKAKFPQVLDARITGEPENLHLEIRANRELSAKVLRRWLYKQGGPDAWIVAISVTVGERRRTSERTCVTCKHWEFFSSAYDDPTSSKCKSGHWSLYGYQFGAADSEHITTFRLKLLTARTCGDYEGVE
jgi:hypothetical protein